MREEGTDEKEIAAAFFVSVHVVNSDCNRQRSARLYSMFMPMLQQLVENSLQLGFSCIVIAT
tara:strand:- start:4661 stop:4846 length:186 start_codon:yes stop_codon:yes gene_type:complete